MASKPKKGVAGKGTGTKARAAISKARKKGSTTEQIAKAAMRDPSTIALIENGTIKNPPANLTAKIKKSKSTSSTPSKKTTGSKKKAQASRKKHS